jgi:hypothetical protein
MITIEHEITIYGLPFRIIAEAWPEADSAADAIRWTRNWIEDRTPTQARVLHYAMTARQTWAGEELRLMELDEAEEILRAARTAFLPFFTDEDEPPRARRLAIRADGKDEEAL